MEEPGCGFRVVFVNLAPVGKSRDLCGPSVTWGENPFPHGVVVSLNGGQLRLRRKRCAQGPWAWGDFSELC